MPEAEIGMLEKLMQTGRIDQRLTYYLEFGDDNELMREFQMRKKRAPPEILQPFPDFGFNNELHFVDQEEVSHFWKLVSDFILAKKPKFERLKNFVHFNKEDYV
jgi:hypothetical protein